MSSSVHAPVGAPVPQLTPREKAALTAAAMGYTQQVAARHFHISYRVLGRYLGQAAARLGAANTTHAVVLALLAGQLDSDRIRARVLPAWPLDVDPEERLASLRARLELGRAERSADAAERFDRFARLLDEGLSPKEAGARLGLARRTAQRYEERFERRRLEATARGEGAHTAGP